MPQIRVPHQFFIDERKKLYDWQPDFWRELIQNSVDAGARNISITVIDCGGGQIRCEVNDDGCGMTLDVLNDVYFALGATTKTGGDSIGGFGRARIMTCFGHDRYEIETLTNMVRGCGAEYEVDQIDRHDGCLIRVWMSEVSTEAMLRNLHGFLRQCSLDRRGINVSINGEAFSGWLKPGRKMRQLSFGDVHVNRSGTFDNRVIFRIGGLAMFYRHSNCKKQVVVEIDPQRARGILSANRNSFVGEARSEVDRFVDEITVDDRSALRDRYRETRKIVRGAGSMIMVGKSQRQEASQRVGKAGLAETVEVTETGSIAEINGGGVVGRSAALSPVSDRAIQIPVSGNRFARDLFDVLIINETGDPEMDAVVARYDPDNWTNEVKRSGGVQTPYKRGREAYRLLIAYKVALEEALRIMVDTYDIPQMAWSVGWVFGWQEGCHLEMDGTHVFCLNPVEGKKAKYRLTSKADLLALLAIAKHEAAHARVDMHNENWGSTLTEIDKRYDSQAVIKRIKQELADLGV
jgi:hypothetical protein